MNNPALFGEILVTSPALGLRLCGRGRYNADMEKIIEDTVNEFFNNKIPMHTNMSEELKTLLVSKLTRTFTPEGRDIADSICWAYNLMEDRNEWDKT